MKSYHCGQKPGKGTYVCTYCKEDLTLDDDDDVLPPCQGLNGTCKRCEFRKK